MAIIKILARWLLVIVCTAIIAVAIIQGSRYGVILADGFCSEQNMIGGACVETWHTGLVETAIYIGLVLCTACLVIVPSAIAPAIKRPVAIVGGILCPAGLGAFYYLTSWPELFLPMLISILTAVFALLWVWPRRSTNAD